MRHKQTKITVVEIAGITGLPESTVRQHRRDGKLDMDDVLGVVRYVMGYWLLKGDIGNRRKS